MSDKIDITDRLSTSIREESIRSDNRSNLSTEVKPHGGSRRGSNNTRPSTPTLSEVTSVSPKAKFARIIEDTMRRMDKRAKAFCHKYHLHEEESVDTCSSCMHGTMEDAINPFRNEVLDSIIAKGTPAYDSRELFDILHNTEHLHLLNSEEINDVIKTALRREYLPGEVILAEGGRALHMYIVVWGEVEVYSADNVLLQQQQQQLQEQKKQNRRNSKFYSISSQVSSPSSSSPAKDERGMTHCGTIKPGMLFSVEVCLFEELSPLRFVAGSATDRTVVMLLPFSLVQSLLNKNAKFAQSVGRRIGEKDIFIPVREFCRYVFSPSAAKNEYLPLWTILERYTKIENVIHTKLTSNELDTAAWGYALKRLPENVTTTFCFDLVLALPPFVATRMREEAKKADVRQVGKEKKKKTTTTRTAVTYITTKERRRCTWHLGMEGKALVLLRDGFTDLLDFLSMLCVHIIESHKLRSRVQGMAHPPAIDVLDDYLRKREVEENSGVQRSKEEELENVKNILATMPLTKEEQHGLLGIWNEDCLVKIYEVMMHREEFNVRVDPSISRKFQINPFHEWALNLRACILENMGMDKNWAPPDDLCIDIVSSNTHCIKNLLSSFHRKNRAVIEEYARRDKRLGDVSQWHTLEDALYASSTGLLANERSDLKEDYIRALEESSITVLTDTAMTGLQVDVIPVHALNFETIDSVVKEALRTAIAAGKPPNSTMWRHLCQPIKSNGGSSTSYVCRRVLNESSVYRLERHFIINMDFAFGAQAEGICRAIFAVFGHRIRSVNVMGKAGGLVGKRGDIQLPTEVLMSKSSLIMEDTQDELRRCRNQGLTAARLKELAGPRVAVHEGRMLTIAGTMLQNVRMLRFYKHIWGCCGAEMEGSYFARVIEDFYRQGIANKDLETRFAYYSSDLPLGASSNINSNISSNSNSNSELPAAGGGGGASLSAPMTLAEGVPPLYAIARGILENVLLPR